MQLLFAAAVLGLHRPIFTGNLSDRACLSCDGLHM